MTAIPPSLTLVVLAAGAGTRFGGLKQLSPIGPSGERLLEYTVFDAVRSGFSKVVLVIRPEHEPLFREQFDRGMSARVETSYCYQGLDQISTRSGVQRTKPWGTGHAVLAARGAVEGPFAVVNADDFYGADSFQQMGDFLRSCATDWPLSLAVVGFPVDQTLTDSGAVSRALCVVDVEGQLQRIVELHRIWRRDEEILYEGRSGEELSLKGDEIVSMNMWGFSPPLFEKLGQRFERFVETEGSDNAEFLLPEVVQDLLREERIRVTVLRGRGRWCGLTFKEDRESVTDFLRGLTASGAYPARLWDPL